jgi:hypothetical protein
LREPCFTAEITGYTVMNHLDKHNILVDFQHGFRNKRSCESQLVITIEDIARNLDNNQQVDMLILDFSKASPFLNSAVTFATSQSFGTLCSLMDFVKINCRYGDIDSAASFNILPVN